jgi:DNA excision repair protein ERCC-2
MRVHFRHERVRKHQDELISDISACIENKRHLVACAPAGTGKTDSSLSPALSYVLENGSTVFFLTPKISQHEMAVNVLAGLKKKYPELGFRAVDVIGKRYMCADPLLKELEPEEFYELCKRKKQAETCKYYSKARGYDLKGKTAASLRQKEILE